MVMAERALGVRSNPMARGPVSPGGCAGGSTVCRGVHNAARSLNEAEWSGSQQLKHILLQAAGRAFLPRQAGGESRNRTRCT